MVGPSRPQIVLFGSSIVQLSFGDGGWGAILAHLYSRKADIVLRGYSGWNSRRALQVLHQVFPKDASVQPSLVIVYFGGNDSIRPDSSGLGPHVPLSEYIENMKKIASYLQGLSEKTRLIFLTAPPVNEKRIRANLSDTFAAMGRTNELCRVYSEACLQLCRELNVKAVDVWTAIQKHKDWSNACFIDDGIHLSSEGSKIVAKEILEVLKVAEWEPSLYWRRMPSEFSEDSPYDPLSADGKSTINVSECTFSEQWESF